MENNDNKKTLILSIVGILVLVIAVVGVSFAMYQFSAAGTQENVIKTGKISMYFDPDATGATQGNNFTVTNKYPMTDAEGVKQTDSKVSFGVKADWGSNDMTIKYEIGITDQANVLGSNATLTEDYIKVVMWDGEGNVVVGTANAGVTIGSLKNTSGPEGLINQYYLTGGSLTVSGTTDEYSLVAYVADNYDLPTDVDTTGNATDVTTDNQVTGKKQEKSTKSETFTFKLNVSAKQI